MVIPVTAVLPQRSSPILQYYREFHFRYLGFPAVTAVYYRCPHYHAALYSELVVRDKWIIWNVRRWYTICTLIMT